ncbi:MAG: hypothetical protein FWH48_08285, partial [Oscillospiraceae bacterium]|nr:hypothetical protein [Oscillospiraceae bacterium]
MRKKLLVLLFILLFLLLFLLGLLIYSFVSKLNASSGPTEAEAEAGLEPDDGQSEQTATPKLVGRTFVAQDRYCIAGNGEEGAKIRVEGGNATAYAEVTDGQFIAEIFVDAQSEADIDISVYATLEGKSESEPLSFVIKSGEARSYRPVYVGK